MTRSLAAVVALCSTMSMGEVLGTGNFTHVVSNLDRSIEFYRDSIGLSIVSSPTAFAANPERSSLFDVPGAQSRTASFQIPESWVVFELVEFQGVNATPLKSRFFDPGAVTLVLPVKDVESVKTRLHRVKGLEWISASNGRVTVKDPDGLFVRLEQPLRLPGVTDPFPPSEAMLDVTVENLDRTTKLYWDVLGFSGNSRGGSYTPDGFRVNLSALDYADRKPGRAGVHDPGVGVLQLRVTDFDATLTAVKAAGAVVVSSGGEPVGVAGSRSVILRDLNNFFLQLIETRQ